ncbi:hypothetical protein [Marinomonas sp. CT5]|uniref:hypothetical protein n=1 Tax=Marinomonas sp. CT5 TaxID=2066133 RepID=UPI001BAFABF6|nr:hypothetical protein [Marinomonas sp. CT5]
MSSLNDFKNCHTTETFTGALVLGEIRPQLSLFGGCVKQISDSELTFVYRILMDSSHG